MRIGLASTLIVTAPGFALAAISLSGASPPVPTIEEAVALVLVDKSDRELSLLSTNKKVLASFPVVFGDNPVGHKQREGDERTPEGRYTLDWRNPNSSYYLSVHVSYPNKDDVAAAEARGEDPGGMIMVHGQPNGLGWLAPVMQQRDWTDGCIALTNAHMDVVWNHVPNGTPIVIRP